MAMLIMPVKQIKKMQSKNAEEILAKLRRWKSGRTNTNSLWFLERPTKCYYLPRIKRNGKEGAIR